MANLIYDYTASINVNDITIDLSSTPIQKGELWEITMTGSTNGAVPDVSLTVNGNNTVSNYYYQRLEANSSTISAARGNDAYITGGSGKEINAKVYLRLTNDGHFVALSKNMSNSVPGSTTPNLGSYYITSTFTMSSVTELYLLERSTGYLNSGFRLQLRKVAKKVDEVEVTGSAVTSVQFSGLSISKTDNVVLVSDVANGASTDNALRIAVNNNTTITNYYYQQLQANSTTVSGARLNENRLGFIGYTASVNRKTSIIANIKLTNDGYFSWQSSTTLQYDYPTGMILQDLYGTSTFTSTSITQIDLVAGSANGIGVGSKFELYKLI